MGSISSQLPPGKYTTTPATRKIRRLTFNDYEQVAGLEARYRLGVRSYDDWSHFWLGNPAYRELQSSWIIGWVIEDAGHRIVGSLGSIPLWYEFRSRRVLAVTGRSLVAEPGYRSACLLLLDRLIHQTNADLYLNNTVGLEAAASFELFQCPRVPVGVLG